MLEKMGLFCLKRSFSLSFLALLFFGYKAWVDYFQGTSDLSVFSFAMTGLCLGTFLFTFWEQRAPRNLFQIIGLMCLSIKEKKLLKEFTLYTEGILTKKEEKTNGIVWQFVSFIFTFKQNNVAYSRMSGYSENLFYKSTSLFNEYKDVLIPIYQKHFSEFLILPKTLIQFTRTNNPEAKHGFNALWDVHGKQFSVEEVEYINQHIHRMVFFNNFELLKKEEVFSALNKSNQEKILKILEKQKCLKFDTLVSIYRNNKGYEPKINVNINQVQMSQTIGQRLNELEAVFLSIFEQKHPIFQTTQDLFLKREKLLNFMKQSSSNQFIEDKLFLENDLPSFIQNFQNEMHILQKMKLTEHHDLEQRKQTILDSIIERVNLMNQKVKDISSQVHASIDNELELELGVNSNVLHSKM